MEHHDMQQTLAALVAPGKGLLAADESFPTMEKRFAEIELPSTEEHRRAYRELLFTAPGIEQYLSGQGKTENVPDAQQAMLHRARCNGAACFGQYTDEIERQYP